MRGFSTNSTIYETHEKLRYIEYTIKNNQRNHILNSVDKDFYIDLLIEKAKNGARFSELLETIANDEFDENEKIDFIEELITAQLLVSELDLSVTGEPMDTQLRKTLNTLLTSLPLESPHQKGLRSLLSLIDHILLLLKEIDKNGIDKSNIFGYREINIAINRIGSSYQNKYVIQTDLQIQPIYANINKSMADDVLKAIDIVSRFTTTKSPGTLDIFKRKFFERWEEQEVPLVKVLDNELGIGYPVVTDQKMDFSPILDEILLTPFTVETETVVLNKKLNDFWIQKYHNAKNNNLQEIVLTPEDVNEFKSRIDELSFSFSALISVFKVKNEQSENSFNSFLLKTAGGSSATNLISRFCHNDTAIASLAKVITDKEMSFFSNQVVAEIVHLPESRTGNILMRPHFHKFEIPFLSKSDLDSQFQIPINDLMVSVRNNELKIRSKRLDKEIIPRLTSAHNFHFNSLPIYHFLCDVQSNKNLTWIKLDTGNLESGNKYIPRISYLKNIVLQPAKWKLAKEDYQYLLKSAANDIDDAFQQFRSTWNFPQYIALQEGDNELVIDTDDKESLFLFINEIRNKQSITIIEVLFDLRATQLVSDGHKNYANELIFFFNKKWASKDGAAEPFIHNELVFNQSRSFYPGSEWVYFKIYTGYKSADELLTDHLDACIKRLYEQKLITKFFFIRYVDTDFHLRIRLLATDVQFFNQIVFNFNESLQSFIIAGIVWKVQLDTYCREIERYGFVNIVDSETIFSIDSNAVINIIRKIEGNDGEIVRWFCGVRMVEGYMSVFQLNLEEKYKFIANMRNSMKAEFNADKSLNKQLDNKYRTNKEELRKWIECNTTSTASGLEEFSQLIEIICERDAKLSDIVAANLVSNTDQSIKKKLSTYIHMNINRLFRSQNRLHEFIIYSMLEKHYCAKIGRINHSNEVGKI